jgi:hypothetical protein
MKHTDPPWLATWILRRFGDQYRRDALLGDLVEEYRRGRSNAWFWRQVFCALIAGARVALRKRQAGLLALATWWSILLALTFASKSPVILFALDPSVCLLWRKHRQRSSGHRPRTVLR